MSDEQEKDELLPNCTYKLREQGKPYPRTCRECGLGPCKALRQQSPAPASEEWVGGLCEYCGHGGNDPCPYQGHRPLNCLWEKRRNVNALVEPVSPPSAMGELLPLPSHRYCLNSQPVMEGYTAEQMKEYGQLCQQGGGWLLGSSAPKDGTEIIALDVYFFANDPSKKPHFTLMAVYFEADEDAWVTDEGEVIDDDPSYWLPRNRLPAPPQPTQGEGE